MSNLDRLTPQIIPHEGPTELQGRHTGRRSPHERVDHGLSQHGTLADQNLCHLRWLLRRVAPAEAWRLDNVGHSEVVKFPLSLLKEQDQLVPSPVVITHPELHFVPD